MFFVKIRMPLVGLTALAAAAISLAASGSPAKAASTDHFLLMNVGTGECATQNGTADSLYLTACPNAASTTINHSLLWSQNGYGQIVNMHSDDCMIVTGATSGSGVWLTGPTAPGSGYCSPVSVDEWTSGNEGVDIQITNAHSHLNVTADPSTGGLLQVAPGADYQWWVELPTNSAD